MVRGEVLECFTAPTKFVHSSASLGCTPLSHDTTASFTVNKGQDNRRTVEHDHRRVLFSFIVSSYNRTERSKRFRSESDAMCHTENKQEGNLSRREESGFLRI